MKAAHAVHKETINGVNMKKLIFYLEKTEFINDENGLALITCLLLLTMLTMMSTSAIFISSINQKMSGNHRRQNIAFYIAEAGIQRGKAEIVKSISYRGNNSSTPTYTTGTLTAGSQSSTYTTTFCDNTNDNNGVYDSLIPSKHIKLISTGVFNNSTQIIEAFIEVTPDQASDANSPYAAVVTSGPNTGSGPHVINGYDEDGVHDQSNMVKTFTPLPTINQEALKAFADYSFSSVSNTEIDSTLTHTDFFKDPPTNSEPWIIHVSGNFTASGNRHVYGIIYVEGNVSLSGSVRIHGVIYAPNCTSPTQINGGGSPGDQPVMGQIICATGIDASGNHADVQLVPAYVDAFNNYGGSDTNAEIISWKQS